MRLSFEKSLCLALAGLTLMMLTGAWYRPVEAAIPSSLIATRDGYSLYAGETPPAGEERFFDLETLYQGLLLYVGPDHPLPSEMPVLQARNVRKFVGLYVPASADTCLSEETIYALCDLCTENPLLHTWIMDGMRSPRAQNALQTAAFARYQQIYSLPEALKRAVNEVPSSGYGEHQLNTCFDLQLNGALDWQYDDPMLRSEDGRWLLENGWRYGFIRRYPPEKRAWTKTSQEQVHMRYVGTTHATILHVTGWCLEEYLTELHAAKSMRLITPAGETVWILCQPIQENGAVFALPAGNTAAPSADNLGYAICVFSEAEE